MTASVAGRYLGARIKGSFFTHDQKKQHSRVTNEWAGRRIAQTLGELKGPLMKIGQMASISSGFLPKEISDALAVLRKDVSFAPFEVIAAQIERELGAPPERLFAAFDTEPFAAASIGQVHRAVSDDGRSVVVKVQYPDISDSMDTDIAQLRLALKAVGIMRSAGHKLDSFFEEISVQLHEELDYCNEADNIRLLGEFHRKKHPHIHIPAVVGERSSERVLTMTFEDGDPLEKAAQYPPEIRNLIGERLTSLVYSQILDLGALHADPNPANFAFRPDGDIVLYDFGSVKKLKKEEQLGVRSLLRGIFDRDTAEVARGFEQVGMLPPGAATSSLDLFEGVIRLIEPAVQKEVPFDAAHTQIHRKVIELWPKIRRRAQSFKLTAAMMMIQRVNVGTYGNLRRLSAVFPLRDIIEEILDDLPNS
jgi:predicted unusual protein kinase regulating ubiquinone biosynthesis (AarF/ABC1/UbiB family)